MQSKTGKSWKKLLAVLLCAALTAGAFATPAAAAEKPSAAMGAVYSVGDWALKGLLKLITVLMPQPNTPCEFPESKNFFPGDSQFLPVDPAKTTWELGFAQRDMTSGVDIFDGNHYVTGGLAPFSKRNPTDVLDEPTARITVLDDKTGRGLVAFVSIDAFGITSADVANIRDAVVNTVPWKTFRSINVSALHQHSVIDTLGMNGMLAEALFLNPLANLTGLFQPFSGKNPAFMKNLSALIADAAKEAVGNLEPGQLLYSKVDVADFINDKRDPQKIDPYFHRLRFVPTNAASSETWLTNVAIHTTGAGTDGLVVTADFPAYIAKEVWEKKHANFQMINGAQLAIGINYGCDDWPDGDRYEALQVYGRALAQKLINIPAAQEQTVPAMLNFSAKEFVIPIDNPLHILFFRTRMIESTCRKTDLLGLKLEVKTEVGYMEIGDQLAVALVPGELDPGIAFGGGLSAEDSWQGWDWEFTSMQETVGSRELLVFGLTNDQIGYIILPNDIGNLIAFGNEEVNAASTKSADLLLAAFQQTLSGVKR
ncbi:MAG: hypothetical protein LBJ11_01190 [Oscillospiraceae bacterium]|jgi:hypothetical protein|nr:hypothetical protein [Oscillospiraceae bacterium]